MIRCVTEEQHSNNCARESYTRNVCLSGRVRICVWVDGLQHRVDRSDDLQFLYQHFYSHSSSFGSYIAVAHGGIGSDVVALGDVLLSLLGSVSAYIVEVAI